MGYAVRCSNPGWGQYSHVGYVLRATPEFAARFHERYTPHRDRVEVFEYSEALAAYGHMRSYNARYGFEFDIEERGE